MSDFWHHAYTILNAKLFSIAGTPVTVTTLITLIVIMIAGWVVARLISRAIHRGFRARGVTDEGTIGITTRLLNYTIFVVTLGVGLQTIGVNLSALLAAGAVFAVAIGFAMQNVVQNFVSGLILLVERTIKPGDILEVDGDLLRIQTLGIRATVARTRDEEDVIIPNSKLVQSSVKNYTFRDRQYRIRAVVGVTYGSNMRQVREVLERVGSEFAGRDPEHEPVVLLKAFGSSSVDWELSVWTNDPWTLYPTRCGVHEAIWNGFLDAKITIAFPQLDVHFDPVVNETITRLRPAA